MNKNGLSTHFNQLPKSILQETTDLSSFAGNWINEENKVPLWAFLLWVLVNIAINFIEFFFVKYSAFCRNHTLKGYLYQLKGTGGSSLHAPTNLKMICNAFLKIGIKLCQQRNFSSQCFNEDGHLAFLTSILTRKV